MDVSDEDKALESPAQSNIVEKVTEALAPPSIYAGAGKIADETALSDGGAAETAKDAAPNHADEAVDGQVLHTEEEEEARLAFEASSADHNQKTKLFVATMYASKDRRVQLYKEKEEEARKLKEEKEELKEINKQLKEKNKRLQKHAKKLRKAANDFSTFQTEGPTTNSDAEHSEQGEGYDKGEEEEDEDDVTVEVHRTPISQSKW
jgi:hypothetical protein